MTVMVFACRRPLHLDRGADRLIAFLMLYVRNAATSDASRAVLHPPWNFL